MRSFSRVLLASLAAASCAALPACSDEPPPDEEATPKGDVIVGLLSDLRAGLEVHRLHVVEKVNDAVVRERDVTGDDLAFPLEFPFEALEHDDLVQIGLEAYNDYRDDVQVSRLASTRIVADRKLLLRAHLEAECAKPAVPNGPGFEGTCEPPTTCIAGACNDSYVSPDKLEEYTATWPDAAPDACFPVGAGEPTCFIGIGQADYLPIDDGEVAQVEAGPQGGHHIWIAVRMKNVHQFGTITTVRGHFEGLVHQPSEMSVIFSYEPDEGGYCKLFGIRYQLDTDYLDIHDVLGRQVEITVELKDKVGITATATKRIRLSNDII